MATLYVLMVRPTLSWPPNSTVLEELRTIANTNFDCVHCAAHPATEKERLLC